MSMSTLELRRRLSAIEPDEGMYEGIGEEEVDALRELLGDPEPWMGARAAHALSRIKSDAARDALVEAAASDRPELRVAVAAEAKRLPPPVANRVLPKLLADDNPGVRKVALNAASSRHSKAVRQQVAEMASAEDIPALRRLAEEKARSLSP